MPLNWLWHFEIYHVCIGKPYVCNVPHPCATWGAWPRVHINMTTITEFLLNCLLPLCDPCAVFCFLLLVCGLTWKKKIDRSTWGNNFYLGTTQNGLKLEIWPVFFIHALELVTALWSFPIWKAIHLQCFLPTCYVRGVVMWTYERDDHCSNTLYACLCGH